MGRDTVQLETAVNTISQEYLLEFTSEYGIPEALHPELPGPKDRIVDFLEGKFGQEAGEEYPPMLYQALGLSQKLEQPLFWVDERVFPTVADWRTSALKDWMPAENTYSAEAVTTLDTHRTPIQKQPDILLCLVGISRRYYLGDEVYGPVQFNSCSQSHKEMEDPAAATDSSGVPSTIKRFTLDFANEAEASDQGTTALEVLPSEDLPTTRGAPEAGQAEEVTATDPSVVTESRKRGHDGVDANAPPKVLRRDHADPRPTGSTREGKSLAAIELGMTSTRPVPMPESAPADVSDPDPLSFVDPQSRHPADVAQSSQGTVAAKDPESKNVSFASAVGSPESIYRPEWGVANGSILDTPKACQDLVDHVAPSGYFSELCHLHNADFLRQYNVNLARQVAMGSQLRLRFEQEAKLLRKSVAQVAHRGKRIQAREHEIKNLEALLEAEADMKKAATDKTIACRRWMIGRGLRLTVIKCGESLELRQAFADVVFAGIAKGMSKGLRHGVKHGQAQLSLESIEAYDPEAEAKYVAALQALKDLKYPLVDQLEGLKDAPMDVRDPMNPWAYKEEMLLADAIAANVSRAEKKKKCRIVCRTHGVGSAHHARSNGVPVSVPTVVTQGLAILLADAATQTEPDEATLDNL
nr:hypothetical protein [Tanacetum cinerariifolium]